MRTPSSHISVGCHYVLISGIYHLCERKKYAFNVLPEYSIITLMIDCILITSVIQYSCMKSFYICSVTSVQFLIGTTCFASGKPAKKWTYWGRSY